MKHKIACSGLTIVALIIFFASGAFSAEKEIRIGFMTDLTSMLSINGISMKQAAILAMEEVGYKIAGSPAKLIIEDEASDPAIAMDRARKLVEKDKVCLVVGTIHAGCAGATAEYYGRTRTPNLGPSYNMADGAQIKATWTWVPFGTNESIGYASGVYTAEVLGYKTAATMAMDYVAGRAFTGGFVTAFTERGGKIIQDQWIPMGTKDIAPYITALKEADVLVPWFAGVTVTGGVRQIREFKVKMPIVFPQCQFPAFPKQLATTVRSIIGFTPPRSGAVCFKGKVISGLPSYQICQMGLALAPQGRAIFPSLTVEENLTIGARSVKKGGGWSLEKAYSFFPHLKRRSKNKGNLLSGGEQQMLCIARAMLTNPDFLIMDEASEGLAPLIVREIGEFILQLKRDGFSILLVEQNLPMALRVSDYVYIVGKGEIVYQSTPEELRNSKEIQNRYLSVKA